MRQIVFAYPQALVLLLVLPLVAYLSLSGRRGTTTRRHWLSLGVRCLLLALLVFALAGPRLGRQEDKLAVVFLIDASDSVGPDNKALAFRFVKEAIDRMKDSDAVGIVVFGADALVERPIAPDKPAGPLESIPTTSATDIGAAIRLAMALFPSDSARRLVLLSDGNDNGGSVEKAVRLARASGAEVSVVPLISASGREVLVDRLDAPGRVRQGERFDLRVSIISSDETMATVRLSGDGALMVEDLVRLQRGENRLVFPVVAQERGFRRFSAQITTPTDTFPQNNEAAAFTTVWSKPRVLLVPKDGKEALSLLPALKSTQADIDVLYPDQLPMDVARLSSYDSIILSNVPAEVLGEGKMKALQTYVRDLGKGLVVIGGEESYGAGGYFRTPLEEALPVTMDYRSQLQSPNVSIVFAVDKSGSMGRCHGNAGVSPGSDYLRVESGVSKIELVKEAVFKATEALSSRDEVGVVAFDSVARWAFPTQAMGEPHGVRAAMDGLQAEGGTNVYAGLDEAVKSLKNSKAKNKHIILMTDGWSRTGDFDSLVRQMKEDGITLSTIAAGGGAADLLQDLAVAGGGRYYAADNVDNIPQILAREAQLAQRSLIVEEPFYAALVGASPVMQGLHGLPRLEGYVATTPKSTAQVVLASPEGDPVLAQWQYGLGRALAWTSDAKAKWAGAWVGWNGFPLFWSQAVRWTLQNESGTGLQGRVSIRGATGIIEAEAIGEDGEPLNLLPTNAIVVSPGLDRQEVSLRQTAPGRYEGRFTALEKGAYLVQITQERNGSLMDATTVGAVLSYSPEYRDLAPNTGLLKWVAEMGKGKTMASPAETLIHDLPVATAYGEYWPLLVILALLLLPVDIGLRRLIFGRGEVERARRYIEERLPGRAVPRVQSPQMGQLMQAKLKVRSRQERRFQSRDESLPPREEGPSPVSRPAPGPSSGTASAGPTDSTPADPLERLRRAKERARPKDRFG